MDPLLSSLSSNEQQTSTNKQQQLLLIEALGSVLEKDLSSTYHELQSLDHTSIYDEDESPLERILHRMQQVSFPSIYEDREENIQDMEEYEDLETDSPQTATSVSSSITSSPISTQQEQSLKYKEMEKKCREQLGNESFDGLIRFLQEAIDIYETMTGFDQSEKKSVERLKENLIKMECCSKKLDVGSQTMNNTTNSTTDGSNGTITTKTTSSTPLSTSKTTPSTSRIPIKNGKLQEIKEAQSVLDNQINQILQDSRPASQQSTTSGTSRERRSSNASVLDQYEPLLEKRSLSSNEITRSSLEHPRLSTKSKSFPERRMSRSSVLASTFEPLRISTESPKTISLVEGERLRDINSILRNNFRMFKCQELKKMIWKCSVELEDELDAIRTLVPTPLEVDNIFNQLKIWNLLNHTPEEVLNSLSTVGDKFLFIMISGNSTRRVEEGTTVECVTEEDLRFARLYRKKMDVWIFRVTCDNLRRDFLCKINTLRKACREMERSQTLIKFLGIVLACGNFLSSREKNSFGFQLSSLSKLKDSTSRDGKISMLRFLHRFCSKRYPDFNLELLISDLSHVLRAATINIEDVENILLRFKDGIQMMKELALFYSSNGKDCTMEDTICVSVCTDKTVQAMEQDAEQLKLRYESTKKKLQNLAVLYSENNVSGQWTVMFAHVADFLNAYWEVHQQEQQAAASQKPKRRSLRLLSTSKVLTNVLDDTTSAQRIQDLHVADTPSDEFDLSSDKSDLSDQGKAEENSPSQKCCTM
jgi:hypothetical protein